MSCQAAKRALPVLLCLISTCDCFLSSHGLMHSPSRPLAASACAYTYPSERGGHREIFGSVWRRARIGQGCASLRMGTSGDDIETLKDDLARTRRELEIAREELQVACLPEGRLYPTSLQRVDCAAMSCESRGCGLQASEFR